MFLSSNDSVLYYSPGMVAINEAIDDQVYIQVYMTSTIYMNNKLTPTLELELVHVTSIYF